MPTLTTYRRLAAPLCGPYVQFTATSGSTLSVVESTAAPIKSSIDQNDLYADYYLFRPSAAASGDRIRVVDEYDAATGMLTVDLAYTNAADDETVELHGLIPPISDGSGTNDLHALINEALKQTYVLVELTLTASAATDTRHSVSGTYSWIEEPWQIRDVGTLPTGQTDRNRYVPSRVPGYGYKDGNTVYVAGFQAQTTDTIYLKVAAPAYYRCAAAATPTVFTQAGLSAEGDVGLPNAEWVAWQTVLLAWERLGTLLSPGSADEAKRQQERAAAMVSRLRDQHFQLPQLAFRQPTITWGIR